MCLALTGARDWGYPVRLTGCTSSRNLFAIGCHRNVGAVLISRKPVKNPTVAPRTSKAYQTGCKSSRSQTTLDTRHFLVQTANAGAHRQDPIRKMLPVRDLRMSRTTLHRACTNTDYLPEQKMIAS